MTDENGKTPSAPVEGKVYSATLYSGAGVVLTPFILWLLGVTIWHVPFAADSEYAAIKAVPGVIAAPLGVLITMGSTMLGGYLAKHTPRPEITEALENLDEVESDVDDEPDEDDSELGSAVDPAPEVDVQDELDPEEPKPSL